MRATTLRIPAAAYPSQFSSSGPFISSVAKHCVDRTLSFDCFETGYHPLVLAVLYIDLPAPVSRVLGWKMDAPVPRCLHDLMKMKSYWNTFLLNFCRTTSPDHFKKNYSIPGLREECCKIGCHPGLRAEADSRVCLSNEMHRPLKFNFVCFLLNSMYSNLGGRRALVPNGPGFHLICGYLVTLGNFHSLI